MTRLTARLAQLERDLEAATSRSVADVLTAKQDVEDRLRSLDADKRAAYVVWGVGLGWGGGGRAFVGSRESEREAHPLDGGMEGAVEGKCCALCY